MHKKTAKYKFHTSSEINEYHYDLKKNIFWFLQILYYYAIQKSDKIYYYIDRSYI